VRTWSGILRRSFRRGVVFSTMAILCYPGSAVMGHESLGRFIQHRALCTIGSVNIDLQLELTFHPPESTLQHHQMDANRNGRVDPREFRTYARRLARIGEERVRILVDGRSVPVSTLYEPEYETFGDQARAESCLVLRLFLFARTPSDLKQEGVIQIHDRLWPNSPAMCFLEAAGGHGMQIIPETFASLGSRFTSSGEERVFWIRYGCAKDGGKTPLVRSGEYVSATGIPENADRFVENQGVENGTQ
jgi:hypothetical protein